MLMVLMLVGLSRPEETAEPDFYAGTTEEETEGTSPGTKSLG